MDKVAIEANIGSTYTEISDNFCEKVALFIMQNLHQILKAQLQFYSSFFYTCANGVVIIIKKCSSSWKFKIFWKSGNPEIRKRIKLVLITNTNWNIEFDGVYWSRDRWNLSSFSIFQYQYCPKLSQFVISWLLLLIQII